MTNAFNETDVSPQLDNKTVLNLLRGCKRKSSCGTDGVSVNQKYNKFAWKREKFLKVGKP